MKLPWGPSGAPVGLTRASVGLPWDSHINANNIRHPSNRENDQLKRVYRLSLKLLCWCHELGDVRVTCFFFAFLQLCRLRGTQWYLNRGLAAP